MVLSSIEWYEVVLSRVVLRPVRGVDSDVVRHAWARFLNRVTYYHLLPLNTAVVSRPPPLLQGVWGVGCRVWGVDLSLALIVTLYGTPGRAFSIRSK